MSKPTPDNVSPEYRLLIHEPSTWGKQNGAIVSLFGGSPCPWCNEDMAHKELGSFIGICKKNPEHVVQWIPWGG